MRYLSLIFFFTVMLGMVGCKGCKSDSEYKLTNSTMAAIDSICEDLAKVKVDNNPPLRFVMSERQRKKCAEHTREMAKEDSIIFRRGYYYSLAGDCLVVEPYSKRKGVIEEVCKMTEGNIVTEEIAAKFNEDDSGYLLIRNADRTLDTIVNYQRIIFTILP